MTIRPFAAFVFCPAAGGGWAATTRAADQGEAGRIGLPGGKLDAGEMAPAAALREAREEGWAIPVWHPLDLRFVHAQEVEGRLVHWYRAAGVAATTLPCYKEQGRITPVAVSLDDIAASGYGNDSAVAALLRALGATRDPYLFPDRH